MSKFVLQKTITFYDNSDTIINMVNIGGDKMFNNLIVKEELKEKGYQQFKLANYLGIPTSTLNDKLNGRSKFNADEAFKISKFLNKDLYYFYNN